jgi:hypothetical protein
VSHADEAEQSSFRQHPVCLGQKCNNIGLREQLENVVEIKRSHLSGSASRVISPDDWRILTLWPNRAKRRCESDTMVELMSMARYPAVAGSTWISNDSASRPVPQPNFQNRLATIAAA